jgi:hypothetical protein
MFTADNYGQYIITARDPKNNKQGSATVVIRTVVARLDVTPNNVVLDMGQTCQFQAAGYDRFNRPVPVAPLWIASGGTITNTGIFSANAAGQYIVTARDPNSNKQATATATIRVVVARVEIVPPSALMRCGQTAQFTATAYDRTNRPMPCTFQWSASGGTMTPTGMYTAGPTPGNYQIIAQEASTGIQAVASVQVVGEPAPPTQGRIVITQWDVGGGNFFKPKAKVEVEVYGDTAQMVKLYAVSNKGGMNELDAASCSNNSKASLKGEYDRFNTSALEVILYDNVGNIIARVKRGAS